MKSSPITPARICASRRTRYVPTYEYFVQVYSGDTNHRLAELLGSGTFAREERKKCDDEISRPVWNVEIDTVKTVYQTCSQSIFEIWQSKDGQPLKMVTVELRKKLFKQKPSRGARIKKGSEIPQPEKIPTVAELEKVGIHTRCGSGGAGFILYRLVGSCQGDQESQIGYGASLALALKNAEKNGHWPISPKKMVAKRREDLPPPWK
jgi:hypothetical protein